MNLAPILKYVSIKVDDLQYAVNFFTDLFELDSDSGLQFTDKENSDKNETFDTKELYSQEGGASIQFVQIDSEKIINPKPNLLQIGIIGIKIKSSEINRSFFHYRNKNLASLTTIRVKPLYHKHFHLVTQNFLFQIKADDSDFFGFFNKKNGGVKGLILGVKDIEKSKEFYKKVLGFNEIIYEGQGKFEDFEGLNGGNNIFKRAIVKQSNQTDNKFKNYFGITEIEFLQVINKEQLIQKNTNEVNPYRFGFTSVDNSDIIGNYIELGYDCEVSGNEEYIEISDPDGITITCQKKAIKKRATFLDDITILSKRFKQKI